MKNGAFQRQIVGIEVEFLRKKLAGWEMRRKSRKGIEFSQLYNNF
jgi:hypothetical protein